MQKPAWWLEAFSPICASIAVAACTFYGEGIYLPCWRGAPDRSSALPDIWSTASRELLVHSTVISLLIAVALAGSGAALYASIGHLGRRLGTNITRLRSLALAFLVVQSAFLIAMLVVYGYWLREYPARIYAGGSPPFFYWHVLLMQSVLPVAAICAGLLMAAGPRPLGWSLLSLVLVSLAMRFSLKVIQGPLHMRVAGPLALAAGLVAQGLHFRGASGAGRSPVHTAEKAPDA